MEAAHTLYRRSPKGSKERQQAIDALLAQEAAMALSNASPYPPMERNQAIQALIELTRRPDLSFEDAMVLDDQSMIVASTKTLERQQLAAKKLMWETVAKRPDLTAEQQAQIDELSKFYRNNT